MKQVLLGAQHWKNSAWTKGFYPEDLPEDWQLAFYANEYGTVVIDLTDFRTPGERRELGGQLMDCHDEFRLLLKVDRVITTPQETAEFLGWLAQLDEDIGIDRLCGIWLHQADQSTVSWRDLAPWRAVINAQLPIAADLSLESDTDQVQQLIAARISPIFRIGAGGIAVDKSGIESSQMNAWLALAECTMPARELAHQTSYFLEQKSPENFVAVIAVIAVEEHSDINQLQDYATLMRLITG